MCCQEHILNFLEKKESIVKTDWDQNQALMLILRHLKKFEKAKMSDFVDLFQGRLSRKQVRTIVEKLVISKELQQEGEGKGTYYVVGESFQETMNLIEKAIEIGMKQLKDNGDIK